TIDAAGNGLPELLAHPWTTSGTSFTGTQVERQKIRIDPESALQQRQASLIRELLECFVVLRPDVTIGHQIDLGCLETQRLRVLLRHHNKRQPIEIGELRALVI